VNFETIFSLLLGSGYFPKELPPTFTTRSFGEFAVRHAGSSTPLDAHESARRWRQYEIHNLARAGTLRRELAIVNPVSYWRLARELSMMWPTLVAAAEASPISVTKPVDALPRNLLRGRNLPSVRAKARSTGKFVLHADISNFYGSIYTHTIPWAIHGKSEARAALKKGAELPGDKLDKLCRAMQDGQSVGLPVGPDSSLLLAEIILAKIDTIVLDATGTKGLRFLDDYELVFDSESQAIDIRTKLQSVLADFRLTLNPVKTAIQKLPVGLDDGWSRELWRMIARKSPLHRAVIIDYFNRAFELAQSRPTAGVLKFALGKLAMKAFADDAQTVAEDLVLQCGRIEAGCLPHVLTILLRRKTARLGWMDTLTQAFNSVVLEHAPQRHSSEVAWALWACLGFKLKLTENAARVVIEMEDSVCSLLLFQAHADSLVAGAVDLNVWKTILGPDDLSGPRWLLAYELTRLGFTVDDAGQNYVTQDPLFGFLYKEGIQFFDGKRVGKVPRGLLPIDEDGDEEEQEEEDEEDETDEYSEGSFWEEWGGDDLEDDDMGELLRAMEAIEALPSLILPPDPFDPSPAAPTIPPPVSIPPPSTPRPVTPPPAAPPPAVSPPESGKDK
jgi:hypothetical protein